MFFQSMKKNSNLNMVFTVLVAVSSVISTNALAGDGRNGPQFNGNAIPVHVDRALTVKDLVDVQLKCDALALKRVLAQILSKDDFSFQTVDGSPMYGDKNDIGNYSLNSATKLGYERAKVLRVNAGIETKNEKLEFFTNAFTTHLTFHPSLSSNRAIVLQLDSYKQPEGITDHSTLAEFPLRPVFVFDQPVREPTYGRLGELITEDEIERSLVLNLGIGLPATGLGTVTGFVNYSTKVPVEIQINAAEHVHCLISEIQKRD